MIEPTLLFIDGNSIMIDSRLEGTWRAVYAVAKNFDWCMRNGRPVSVTLFFRLLLLFLLKSCLRLSGFASDKQ